MTVPHEKAAISYPYTGPGDYVFDFLLYTGSHLRLAHFDPNGSKTELVYNQDYTVVIEDDYHGGICVVDPENIEVGGTLFIHRLLPIEQGTDWVNNSAFAANILESDLDKLVMICQGLEANLTEYLDANKWRGDWLPDTIYPMGDIVAAPDDSFYTCVVSHTSSSSFTDDLANGKWGLMINLSILIQARDDAIAAAMEAEQSANEAAASAADSLNSANESDFWAGVAGDHSDDAGQAADCSYNWATNPEDEPIPPPCGTGSQYSAMHWSFKAEESANIVEGKVKLTGSGSISGYLGNQLGSGLRIDTIAGEQLAVDPAIFDNYFSKDDFIESTTGAADAGKPIILDSSGSIDPSLIGNLDLIFVGSWDPSGGVEYPTASLSGQYWMVNGVTGDYTFTGGDLAGVTTSDGDLMLYSDTGWILLISQLTPEAYLPRDGSFPMIGNLLMGSNQVKGVQDGTDPDDAVNVGQLPGLLSGYVATDGSNPMTGPLQMNGSGIAQNITGLAESTSPGHAVEHQQLVNVITDLTNKHYTKEACDAIFARLDSNFAPAIIYLETISGVHLVNGLGPVKFNQPAGVSYIDRYGVAQVSEEDVPMLSQYGLRIDTGTTLSIPYHDNMPDIWDDSKSWSVVIVIDIWSMTEGAGLFQVAGSVNSVSMRVNADGSMTFTNGIDEVTTPGSIIQSGRNFLGIFVSPTGYDMYANGEIVHTAPLITHWGAPETDTMVYVATDGITPLDGVLTSFRTFDYQMNKDLGAVPPDSKVITSYVQLFTASDMLEGALVIPHNLNSFNIVSVVVYNENNRMLRADEYVVRGVNSAMISLSSFGDINGTYKVALLSAVGADAFTEAFTNNDLQSGFLRVRHNLGDSRLLSGSAWNANQEGVMVDSIYSEDADTLIFDLSSFGTISGTWRASVVKTLPNIFSESFSSGDLVDGVLTVDHNLGQQYVPAYRVFDAVGRNVVPDEVTVSGINTTLFDFSSFDMGSDTWLIKLGHSFITGKR